MSIEISFYLRYNMVMTKLSNQIKEIRFPLSQDKFAELYEKYERSRTVKKKTISALEYFNMLMTERKDTGRIYIMYVDNANNHSSFV